MFIPNHVSRKCKVSYILSTGCTTTDVRTKALIEGVSREVCADSKATVRRQSICNALRGIETENVNHPALALAEGPDALPGYPVAA